MDRIPEYCTYFHYSALAVNEVEHDNTNEFNDLQHAVRSVDFSPRYVDLVGVRRHHGHIARRDLRVAGQQALDGQLQGELAAGADLALDDDVAAMLAEDFAADRQAEPGAARALAADEGAEDVGKLLGRDAAAVVQD